MNSTLTHAVETLSTFGIDIDPDQCDPAALRADVAEVERGILPLHMESKPPRFALDLMTTVANILEDR